MHHLDDSEKGHLFSIKVKLIHCTCGQTLKYLYTHFKTLAIEITKFGEKCTAGYLNIFVSIKEVGNFC